MTSTDSIKTINIIELIFVIVILVILTSMIFLTWYELVLLSDIDIKNRILYSDKQRNKTENLKILAIISLISVIALSVIVFLAIIIIYIVSLIYSDKLKTDMIFLGGVSTVKLSLLIFITVAVIMIYTCQFIIYDDIEYLYTREIRPLSQNDTVDNIKLISGITLLFSGIILFIILILLMLLLMLNNIKNSEMQKDSETPENIEMKEFGKTQGEFEEQYIPEEYTKKLQ